MIRLYYFYFFNHHLKYDQVVDTDLVGTYCLLVLQILLFWVFGFFLSRQKFNYFITSFFSNMFTSFCSCSSYSFCCSSFCSFFKCLTKNFRTNIFEYTHHSFPINMLSCESSQFRIISFFEL